MSRSQNHSSILNLGAGRKRLDGAINIDISNSVKADVVHDLNVIPWPFEANTFSRVVAHDVIEHLENMIDVFNEIHRVCEDGAIVEVTVPHFSSGNAYLDPTHRKFFGVGTFRFLTKGAELEYYFDGNFVVESCRLFFYRSLISPLVSRLANWFPEKYEQRWAWIFPAWFISVRLKVIK